MGGWFFGGGGHGYQAIPMDDVKLPTKEDKITFNYDSIFQFPVGESKDKSKYRSVFKFEQQHDNEDADYYKHVTGQNLEPTPLALMVIHWTLSGLSYLLFLLLLPLTYWVCVVRLGDSDRMVIFRLGKMQGVKGPGRVIVFPWIDKMKRVDIRASAFSVPPQQFISQDGGIVEMGAEVQYAITDVATMVREVADHQDILRSLGKSLLTKTLTKMTVNKLVKDRRVACQRILEDLNIQVRKWGVDIRSVVLSEPKVLKKPEDRSAMGPILQNMGLKEAQDFPSPEQFIRNNFGCGESETSDAAALNTLASAVGGFIKKSKEEGKGLDLSAMANMMGGANLKMMGDHLGMNQMQQSPINGLGSNKQSDWQRCLDAILNSDSGVLEMEAMGVYELTILETELGTEHFLMEVTPATRTVTKVSAGYACKKPDVSVTITSCDLAGVLQGTLSPLQAYLTGRITANGDVKKLMFFDKLSSRGHKPGSMFTI